MPVKRKRKRVSKKKSGLSLRVKIAFAVVLLILLSPFYYGYILKFGSSTWSWINGNFSSDPNYPAYKDFGIRIPKKYSIHGIDVSYYQGKIDWNKVALMKEDDVKIDFAFIKATEGVLLVDRYFQRNWREAPKSGITCGAYHYFRPQKSGRWQAKFFLQTVDVEEGDLPPVVDVEELDGVTANKMRNELKDYLNYIEKRTGVKPIIYTGLSFYTDYLHGYFDGYPLWIAHYYKSQLNISHKVKWQFWQHSDKARVNGIAHKVDFNLFNGSEEEFERLLVE